MVERFGDDENAKEEETKESSESINLPKHNDINESLLYRSTSDCDEEVLVNLREAII